MTDLKPCVSCQAMVPERDAYSGHSDRCELIADWTGKICAILRFDPDGTAETVYTEDLDLTELGSVAIARASHVEPTIDARWTADLSPVGGPVLGAYTRRSEALAAEVQWLNRWLERD